MSSTRPLLFISYATPDRERVLPYHDWLQAEGYETWIDCNQLLPGQNWDLEINRAIDRATLILAFVSENTIARRGYVQRELKIAIDRLRDRLSDDIYIIPILLDDVAIPDELKRIQAISSSEPNCRPKIAAALQLQLERLGHAVHKAQVEAKVSWSTSIRQESWDGLPGYRFELEFLDFSSSEYPNIREVSEHIRGVIGSAASEQRACKLDQSPEFHNYGQHPSQRTNDYEAHCGAPSIRGRVLTVQYALHWYQAGAAHPNYGFRTFSFLLDPVVHIPDLSFIFTDETIALNRIQRIVRGQLLEVSLGEPGEDSIKLEEDWVLSGTDSWDDFRAFVFGNEGIDLLFAPYHVAPYACGPQFASVEYADVYDLVKPTFSTALEIEYFAHKAREAARG